MHHIVTLNAGSSSLKFALFAADGSEPELICSGTVDQIGRPTANVSAKSADGQVIAAQVPGDLHDHDGAIESVLNLLDAHFPSVQVVSVGHRIVHGGPDNDKPVLITPDNLNALEMLVPFAPLHQPFNLQGVWAAIQRFPQAKQVACFDTAFHRNHPWVNDTFALPAEYYEMGVRRYGFHGLSYDYISGHLAEAEPQVHAGRVVVAHLGNGASMCGMKNGISIESSMSFSTMDGLPMGTRCGQIDPGALLFLMQQKGMDADEISDLLYRQSGLLGISGLSNDMRKLEQSDLSEAEKAIEYFTFRARREMGALAAAVGGLDAVVFTGGIGENSARVRARICAGTEWLGIDLNTDANQSNARIISTETSQVRVMVIPTNEELVIARAALEFVT